ncbi:hypothetical protein PUN4_280204 [Paraburkholderia unamae]|nr:hypothetical protein PUN4_280204 [Paraburkholderia unamae]
MYYLVNFRTLPACTNRRRFAAGAAEKAREAYALRPPPAFEANPA